MKGNSASVNRDLNMWKQTQILAIEERITVTEFIEGAVKH
jgi:hypothetical protein